MSADNAPIFVDTNILVYAYDQSAGDKRTRARALMDQLWSDMNGCLSLQVLQEFYVAVTHKVPRPLKPQEAADIVRDYAFWQIHAPIAEDLLGAVELQQRHQMSFWDAMILWSAGQLGCKILWSEDLSDSREYDGVRVVNPFQED
ncbi:MAG: PIN domain-containing protein [Anaerolineales bacterium]|jgi:predicted nucleic acid-binding protein